MRVSMATLNEAMAETYKELRSRSDVLTDALVVRARRRRDYEHAMLRQWSKELEKSVFTPSIMDISASRTSSEDDAGRVRRLSSKSNTNIMPKKEPQQSLLAEYFFGASEDPFQDNIPYPKATSSVEMQDWALHPDQILVLASHFSEARSDGVAATSGCAGTLKRILRKIIDTGSSFPLAWRHPARLEALAAAVTTDDSFATGYDNFTKTLVMCLIISHFPVGPTTEFIKRIGVIYVGADAPTVEELKRKIRLDTKLQFGWLDALSDPKLQRDAVTLQITAIEAVAVLCTDSDGKVDVDALVMTLCKLPSSAAETIFEARLACSLQSSSSTDSVGHLPGLCANLGLCRALVVVQGRRGFKPQTDTPPDCTQPSESWRAFQAYEKPALSKDQLSLLLSGSGVREDAIWAPAYIQRHFGLSTERGLVEVLCADRVSLMAALEGAPQPALSSSRLFDCLAQPL